MEIDPTVAPLKVAVAVAPVPPPPVIVTEGGTVYADPGDPTVIDRTTPLLTMAVAPEPLGALRLCGLNVVTTLLPPAATVADILLIKEFAPVPRFSSAIGDAPAAASADVECSETEVGDRTLAK